MFSDGIIVIYSAMEQAEWIKNNKNLKQWTEKRMYLWIKLLFIPWKNTFLDSVMDSILEFELKSYDTTHPNRGIAVVINDSERREGSEKDVQDVVATLEGLKFNVRTFQDNTKKEIKKALYKVAREDHNENDCLVIVAMAHGKKDHITLKKEKLRIDKLWASFVGNKCPSLIGKPKLVFIQTCRGDKVDFGVASHETDSIMPVVGINYLK